MHVVVFVPWPRPQVAGGQPVWTDERDHRLWQLLSASPGATDGETDWDAIATSLGVTPEECVERSGYLYQQRLRQVHSKLRHRGATGPADVTRRNVTSAPPVFENSLELERRQDDMRSLNSGGIAYASAIGSQPQLPGQLGQSRQSGDRSMLPLPHPSQPLDNPPQSSQSSSGVMQPYAHVTAQVQLEHQAGAVSASAQSHVPLDAAGTQRHVTASSAAQALIDEGSNMHGGAIDSPHRIHRKPPAMSIADSSVQAQAAGACAQEAQAAPPDTSDYERNRGNRTPPIVGVVVEDPLCPPTPTVKANSDPAAAAMFSAGRVLPPLEEPSMAAPHPRDHGDRSAGDTEAPDAVVDQSFLSDSSITRSALEDALLAFSGSAGSVGTLR
eukprot:Opistho-2@80919